MDGVYEVPLAGLRIRIVVPNQLRQEEQNALLHLFSTRGELLAYAVRHFRQRSPESSTLLLQLVQKIQKEIETMPNVLEEIRRETIEQLLKELPVEKRLELLKAVPVEQLLERLTPKQRVQGLSRDQLLELANELKNNGASPKPSQGGDAAAEPKS